MSHFSFKDTKIECFLPAPLIKRASDPHLKGSICGIAAAALKAFFPFKKGGRPAGQSMKADSTPSFFFRFLL